MPSNEVMTKTIVSGDCFDEILIDSAGTISSPGYPVSYPSLTECRWKIKVWQNFTMLLLLSDSFLEMEIS